MRKTQDPIARILAQVSYPESGCWEFTGFLTSAGYGLSSYEGRKWKAHRLLYTLLIGPIPDGMELDHLCKNPACVRPEHMEPVTPGENKRRSSSHAGRVASTGYCIHGHAYTPENTYYAPRTGWRQCLQCQMLRRTAYGEKVKVQRKEKTEITIRNHRKTHCKWGHEFTPENTAVHQILGNRRCRACQRREDADRRARKRARAADHTLQLQ